jgi:hypothetical protein
MAIVVPALSVFVLTKTVFAYETHANSCRFILADIMEPAPSAVYCIECNELSAPYYPDCVPYLTFYPAGAAPFVAFDYVKESGCGDCTGPADWSGIMVFPPAGS